MSRLRTLGKLRICVPLVQPRLDPYPQESPCRPSVSVRFCAVVILASVLATCVAPPKTDISMAQVGSPTPPSPTRIISTITPNESASPFPAEKCLEQAPDSDLPPRRTPLEVQFLTDGNVWIWEEVVGVPQQITSTGDAREFTFSDDGQVVAFVRAVSSDEVELWAVDSDGSHLRRLLSAAQLESMAPNPQVPGVDIAMPGWVDQSHTLRVQVSPPREGIGQVVPYGEWSIDADSGAFSPYTPDEGPTPGLVSPDGKHIAIVTETSVSLMRADGSGRRDDVVTYPFIGQGDYAFIPPTVWAPDSQFLRAITPSSDPFASNAYFTTWIIPLDGPAKALASFNGFPLDVRLSPNQVYVAFWKATEPLSNDRELRLARFDTSTQVLYETGILLEFLGWAPDSAHFVFWQHGMRPLLGHICGAPEPLLATTIGGWVTWIDRDRFLFSTGEEPSQELRLGHIDGSSLLVGPLVGDFATYRFNVDSAAIGLGG